MHPTPMHAHYLTVSESRRWAIDNPVGNPYHDFKTKEMPVVAVAVIAYGASMAYAAGTLLSLGGLMMASGALSLAGQLTGNKTLSTLGAVAGVAAAGIGLWQAAGGFASGVDAASSASGAAAGGEAASSVAQTAQATQVAGTAADAANAASSVNLTLDAGGNLVQAGTLGGSSALSTAAPIVESATNLAGATGSIPAGTMSLDGVSQMGALAAGGSAAPAAGLGALAPVDPSTTNLGSGIGENGAMSVTGNAPTPVDAAAGGAETAGKISVTDPVSGGSEAAISNGSNTVSGPPKPGLIDSTIDTVKTAGKTLMDLNKDSGGSLMKFAQDAWTTDDEQKMMDAEVAYRQAIANGKNAEAELYAEKVKELQWKRQNANTRVTNAAAQAGAVNPNANIFSTAAKPAQGGLIFSGAK